MTPKGEGMPFKSGLPNNETTRPRTLEDALADAERAIEEKRERRARKEQDHDSDAREKIDAAKDRAARIMGEREYEDEKGGA